MKFDKLKPGMFLLYSFSLSGARALDRTIVKHKSNNKVVVDRYWHTKRNSTLHRAYDIKVTRDWWDSAWEGRSCRLGSREDAKKLIVTIFA